MMQPLRMWPALGYFMALATVAGPGYLQVLGPTPLRIQPLVPPVRAILPPLLMKDPEPTNALAKALAAAEAPPIVTTNRSVEPKPPVVTATNTPSILSVTNAQGLVIADPLAGLTNVNDTMITPQMFLPFFQQKMGTNGSNTVSTFILATNLNFAPPTPFTGPPSTATYSTGSGATPSTP